MKTSLLLVVFAIYYLCLCQSAPVADEQSVQFLKYSNDKELEEIQRQIIAQYEHLGGTSQFHESQSVSYIDPNNLNINI